jgi:hypothetical protein
MPGCATVQTPVIMTRTAMIDRGGGDSTSPVRLRFSTMPGALKIFIASLVGGLLGGYVSLQLGSWLAGKFFADSPLALGIVLLATGALGVASAVTTGVLMGKKR